MTEETQNGLLNAMGQIATLVALYSGFKQQFLDAGWSPEAAEQLVIISIKQNFAEQNAAKGIANG
jgi:hypothetical protein